MQTDTGNRYAVKALKDKRAALAGEIIQLKKKLDWAESQLRAGMVVEPKSQKETEKPNDDADNTDPAPETREQRAQRGTDSRNNMGENSNGNGREGGANLTDYGQLFFSLILTLATVSLAINAYFTLKRMETDATEQTRQFDEHIAVARDNAAAATTAAETSAGQLEILRQQLEPKLFIKSAHIEWGPEINEARYVFVIENRGGSDAENVTAFAKGVYTYDFGNPKIGDIFFTSGGEIPGIIRANSESRFVFPVMGPAVRVFTEQKPREEVGLSKLLQLAVNYDARFGESRTVLVEAEAPLIAVAHVDTQRALDVRIIREMPRQPDAGMQYADFFTLPEPNGRQE